MFSHLLAVQIEASNTDDSGSFRMHGLAPRSSAQYPGTLIEAIAIVTLLLFLYPNYEDRVWFPVIGARSLLF